MTNKNPLSIRLISDTHEEGFYNPRMYENHTHAHVLVLAGDINVGAERIWASLKRYADHHEHVVYVDGNHSWYHNSWEECHAKLTEFTKDQSRIHYLCNSMVKIGDVTFIGTPLWTNFRGNPQYAHEVKGLISDFKWYDPLVCMSRGLKAQQWLKKEYENIPGKKVIITHWLPAIECIDPKYATEITLNRYFANDMGDWIKELRNVPYWFFGHTHSSVDIKLGDTRVISNPAGYRHRGGYYENSRFNESAIYEV